MLPEADGTRLLELLPYIHFSRSKPFLFLKKVYKEPAIYSHFKKQPFASFFLFVMHFIKIYFFFFFEGGGAGQSRDISAMTSSKLLVEGYPQYVTSRFS